jgi:hypothetical protein
MLNRGFVRGKDQEHVGHKIMLEVVKNGMGRPRRQVFMDLMWWAAPAPGYPEQKIPISFAGPTVEWLATARYFGVRPEGSNLYSSKELALKEVRAEDVVRALKFPQHQAAVEALGRELHIYGYDTGEVPPLVATEGGQVAEEEVDEAPDQPTPGKEPENPTTVKPTEELGQDESLPVI